MKSGSCIGPGLFSYLMGMTGKCNEALVFLNTGPLFGNSSFFESDD
ncbi:hypothetical protein DYBT9275_00431 [Dyadobacter sp. CECT 9275]|uniref:Uncharacterized protein n=1 Tax=Dyadobacter helix TaxID=2822344 RepID=A0A916J8C1_9BACT|nr:hypothetical protein DYBT9275_00431 [Dyadobacter sp. CECT 9275]